MLIVTKEKEESVLHNRSADGSTKLFPIIFWVERNNVSCASGEDYRLECRRVTCVVLLIAEIEKSIAVKVVSAAFGNSIDDTTRGAPVFSLVVGRIDLKLAYRGLTDRIVDTRTPTLLREEGLIVVAAIHGVVV